jgi:serine/threonine-protein kinase RsbW
MPGGAKKRSDRPAARKMKTEHLHIQSQTGKLNLVRHFVFEAALKFGFDEESASKIMLAVDEACTNVIKHAYEFAPTRDIELEVVTHDRQFEVVILHTGKPFDPDSVTTPDMKKYLSQFRRGGLGMHLMRSLMDNVEYKAGPDGRNEVHLVKYLAGAA